MCRERAETAQEVRRLVLEVGTLLPLSVAARLVGLHRNTLVYNVARGNLVCFNVAGMDYVRLSDVLARWSVLPGCATSPKTGEAA